MKSSLAAVVAVFVLSTMFLVGCATSQKVQVVQVGDDDLTCEQIRNELEKLDNAQNEVDSKKGATGTNVASALFWLPGLAYTYYDAGQAERLITDRKSHLTNIANQKDCKKGL